MKPKKDLMPFEPDKTPSKSPLASGVGEACCEGVEMNESNWEQREGRKDDKEVRNTIREIKKNIDVLKRIQPITYGLDFDRLLADLENDIKELRTKGKVGSEEETNEALSPECYDELIDCKCKGDKKCGKCNESMDEDFSVLENLFDVDLSREDQTTESLCGDKKVEEALKDYTETATNNLDFNKYDYILSVWKESDKSNTHLTSEEVMKVAETLGLDANSTDAFAMSCGEGCTYTAICWDEEPDVEDFYVGDRTTPPEGGVSVRLITEDVKAINKLGFSAEYDKYIDAEDWAESNSYDPYDVDDYKDYD